jgi:hypothetical protein
MQEIAYPEEEQVVCEEGADCETPAPTRETFEEKEAKILQKISDGILFTRAAWTGTFAGLYGMKSNKRTVPKPSEECFGAWIVDDVTGIRDFFNSIKGNFWHT